MFFNRDASWLSFNERVLQEANDASVPLMERIRFLAISSSNLDEFSRVRYPLVRALSQLKDKIKRQINAGEGNELAEQVQHLMNEQLKMFGNILHNNILPGLANEGIILYYNTPIRDEHKKELREIFISRVLSFIQPVLLKGDTSSQFEPKNGQLYFIVTLKDTRAKLYHYIVNIPSDKLPRFFTLSSLGEQQYIIFIDDIIRENMSCIFPGFALHGIYSVKFNRDAELYMEDDFSGNVLEKIEKQLRKRDAGSPSRFLFEPGMPLAMQLFLASSFSMSADDIFEGGRYHNLKDFADLPIKDPRLQYPPFKPLSTELVRDCGNIFTVMEEKDILLHFPYQRYDPILAFFNQSAIDPKVSAIYISLYRVAADSHIVNALMSAARNGKKVIVFVELKARFDEANNIKWSREMKAAGIKLIYSIPNIKVHSKIALVVKQSHGEKRYYALVSTGNFNESTARFYTDHTLLTTNRAIAQDLADLFAFLQRKEPIADDVPIKPKTLLVSGVNMVPEFEQLIEAEMKKAVRGEPALIRIKLNNLEEQQMIEKLYEASRAGVEIRLIARSICCLIPSPESTRGSIRVRRIVDRFLEHSRIWLFGAGNDPYVIIGSADWMTRNLYHRIEVCTPVQDKKLKHDLDHYFELQWNDTGKATELQITGAYTRISHGDQSLINAQTAIFDYLNSSAR